MDLFPSFSPIRPVVDVVMRLGDALSLVTSIEVGATDLTPVLIIACGPRFDTPPVDQRARIGNRVPSDRLKYPRSS